ncbi:hypothetical protein [Pseudoduganella sp.]|uniref:hypothetical protein n=1 Tax=Pseudoduganella sp. TaxID=1880898 RepID=UPI0035ADB00C
MSSRYIPQTVAAFHDKLVSVMLQSPDRFSSLDDTPVGQPRALRQAFEVLQEAFPLVEKKLKDPHLALMLRELLRMSYEFFVAGDDRNGIYALQEVEGSIWPSRKIPHRHAVEAERRAHGRVERLAGVVPNPYPFEGTIEDMGPCQRRLFESVQEAYSSGKEVLAEGQEHYWLLEPDQAIRKLAAGSRKAAHARIAEELATGSARAALRAVNVTGDRRGYDVEESGRAMISVRGELERFSAGNPNFYVDEPRWTTLLS